MHSTRRFAATYSVVARDAATGQLGVAVQSHWYSVGTLVPFAEAGVGAVATQSFADPAYGPLGLAAIRAGRSAPDALRGLVAADSAPDLRQVAIVDAQGRVAVHTGSKCIPAAGHEVGEGFSVQANMMTSPRVWPEMARAYREHRGDLTERLLAALEAAEAVGGDLRGKRSAAILVVAGTPTGRSWADRLCDVRVEDSSEPLVELRRLVVLQRAYQHMNTSDQHMERKEFDGALREIAAAEALAPDNLEIRYWHAVSLASMERWDEAQEIFDEVFAASPAWRELTRRLPVSGVLTVAAAARILGPGG